MALPALLKTYQAGSGPGLKDYVNQAIIAPNSATAASKLALLQVKEAMIGMNSNPWTVVGSSDSLAASLDGTDRWATTTDLINNPGAGAFSWIVLRNTAIAANFEVLFAMSSSNPQDLHISVSPSAGFTGGSTTARPTATDEHVINTDLNPWFGDLSTGVDVMVSVVMSTDGEITRIWGSNVDGSSSVPFMMMGFEVPKDPLPGWSDPSVYYHHTETIASGNNACSRDDWDSTTGRVLVATLPLISGGTQQGLLTLASPFANNASAIDNLDEVNGIRFFGPLLVFEGAVDFAFAETSMVFGSLYDWWWPSLGATNGADYQDSFPASGERIYACAGEMVFGWLDDAETDFNVGSAEFVQAVTGTLQNGAGNVINVTNPGVQEGDILVFVYLGDGSNANIISRPSGWANDYTGSQNMDGGAAHQVVDTKIATGSEPGTWTWNRNGGSSDSLWSVLIYRPGHQGTALDPTVANTNYLGGTAAGDASPSSAHEGARIVHAWLANRNGGTGALGITTPPASATARSSVDGSGIARSDLRIDIYDVLQPDPGAATAQSITYDNGKDAIALGFGIRAIGTI